MLHCDALKMIAHQNGDILWAKWFVAERRTSIVKTPDLVSDRRTALGPGDAFGNEAIRFPTRQRPDHHRCAALRVI